MQENHPVRAIHDNINEQEFRIKRKIVVKRHSKFSNDNITGNKKNVSIGNISTSDPKQTSSSTEKPNESSIGSTCSISTHSNMNEYVILGKLLGEGISPYNSKMQAPMDKCLKDLTAELGTF